MFVRKMKFNTVSNRCGFLAKYYKTEYVFKYIDTYISFLFD